MKSGGFLLARLPLFNDAFVSLFDLAGPGSDLFQARSGGVLHVQALQAIFGHFAQGFIPAVVAREILIRTFRLAPGKFLFFVTTSICLAISAFYELIEWWSALALGQGAHEFLGTQGDEWDTQWDMFMALVGACLSQVLLSRLHDREIASIRG